MRTTMWQEVVTNISRGGQHLHWSEGEHAQMREYPRGHCE